MASGKIHIFFFPFMANGHMIPTLDMAKFFAAAGVKSTIITTPLNAPRFTNSIQKMNQLGHDMVLKIIDFPGAAVGLPEGCEIVEQIDSVDLIPKFFRATTMLQDPLERLLEEFRPNCLIADMLFPWATVAAGKFGIPRLIFHGISFFALCAMENIRLYKPQRGVTSDDEPFLVPNLPHQIKLTKLQLFEDDVDMLTQIAESELASYGVIVNSFYELEPDYVNHYRNVLGRRAWHVGPVSLCNREIEDKAQRGKKASIDEHACLKWLDSKKPKSVIYVCFGSAAKCSTLQLYEIAMGLEASRQEFIWVVRSGKNEEEETENWLPEGFEERMRERGLIIRGWAPQVLILDHEAIGGFVTHCGWNSTLEGVSAGVPMVTWPIFAEQFYNEKLVTEILRVGVSVGTLQRKITASNVGREAIAAAIQCIIVGEEADELRRRARRLKDVAKKAVEEGGSSYSNLNRLIQELSSYQA